MKKLVASIQDPKQSKNPDYMTYTQGGQRFGVHLYSDDPLYPKFQVTEIHPYDDADYTWARCGYKGAANVQFIKNGKVVDQMQWYTYEEDEGSPEDYIDKMIDETCSQLRSFNKDVKPIMVHW